MVADSFKADYCPMVRLKETDEITKYLSVNDQKWKWIQMNAKQKYVTPTTKFNSTCQKHVIHSVLTYQ